MGAKIEQQKGSFQVPITSFGNSPTHPPTSSSKEKVRGREGKHAREMRWKLLSSFLSFPSTSLKVRARLSFSKIIIVSLKTGIDVNKSVYCTLGITRGWVQHACQMYLKYINCDFAPFYNPEMLNFAIYYWFSCICEQNCFVFRPSGLFGLSINPCLN